ncbi:conserved hypothetical protein [Ricinus communis]|uniref:Uncharacterized protein n=1 Tax=Ricinus communis TaxID=3988 RepID=B9S7D6_RICCO|nr:conserved hypothetical protein [Ricinus communis]
MQQREEPKPQQSLHVKDLRDAAATSSRNLTSFVSANESGIKNCFNRPFSAYSGRDSWGGARLPHGQKPTDTKTTHQSFTF